MKRKIRISQYSLIAISILIVFSVFIFGCSTELGMNPEQETNPSASMAPAGAETGRGVPATALRFVELPKSGKGQAAIECDNECYTEGTITHASGGVILLRCNVNDVNIRAKLRVEPYAVDSDVTLSLSVPSENLISDVDIDFGPHGTVIFSPADFHLRVDGLDLSHEDPNTVGFYYYNEERDLWELQDAMVDVDCTKGRIQVRAELYHFSRYAVAFAN